MNPKFVSLVNILFIIIVYRTEYIHIFHLILILNYINSKMQLLLLTLLLFII